MAREKSLSDIDKRIEELKKQKEEIVTDMAVVFAKKVIREQDVSTKKELNEWYEKAKDAIAYVEQYRKPEASLPADKHESAPLE